MSSPSTLPRSYVKVIHVNIETNTFNRQKYHNQQGQILPIIFVRHQKTILIPDFNICTLLKIINSNINLHTIENYVRIFLFINSYKRELAFILRHSLLDITVYM